MSDQLLREIVALVAHNRNERAAVKAAVFNTIEKLIAQRAPQLFEDAGPSKAEELEAQMHAMMRQKGIR